MPGIVFAYGAFRRVEESVELRIGDDRSHPNPLTGATVFGGSVQPGSLETWVANTRTKLALANNDSDTVAVARYERAITLIETTISDLIGEPFTLQVQREPLAVIGVINGSRAPLDTLPDGLRSALAWLGDILRRLDGLTVYGGNDPRNLPIIVLLDEIDAHLHPRWQRSILHVAERLLPNAQLIVSTHSPFVVQSATDSCVVRLGDHGRSAEVLGPQANKTVDTVLDDVLGVDHQYSIETETKLNAFRDSRDKVLRQELSMEALEAQAKGLAAGSESLELDLRRDLDDVRRRIGTH